MKFYKILLIGWLSLVGLNSFAAPLITSLSPAFGPQAGGNTITINGSGFTGATAVTFGADPATTFIVNSDTSISAEVPAGFMGNVTVVVTTPDGSSPANRASVYTYQGDWIAYLGGDPDRITPFTLPTFTRGTTLIGGTFPVWIAFTPDAQTAYIVARDAGVVNIVDVETNSFDSSSPIGLGGGSPEVIAITPDGTKAYVTKPATDEVAVIDIATNAVTSNISVVGDPRAVAISPDGTTAYVTRLASNDVIRIDVATDSVIGSPILVGTFPVAIAMNPQTARAYVVNTTSADVSVIDTTTNTVIATIPTGGVGPNAIAVTPDGLKAYVVNFTSATVTPINLVTNTAGTPIVLPGVGVEPTSIAISPDGATAYIPDNGTLHRVFTIDIATDTLGTIFPLDASDFIISIAITPDQSPVADFTITSAGVSGAPTIFDATASRTPVGTIASYFWDFGDGQTATTTLPTIAHTYTVAGNYTVTLTVTNSAGTSTEQDFSGQTMMRNGSFLATFSQALIVPMGSATAFVGQRRGNVFLNRTECVLIMSWPQSTAPDFFFYRLYRNGTVIFQGNELTFTTCFVSSSDVYELSVVNTEGIESSRVTLRIIA